MTPAANDFAINCSGGALKPSLAVGKTSAKRALEPMLRRIQRAHVAGDRKKESYLIRLHLNSHEAHLFAAKLARRSMKPHRRFSKALIPMIAAGLDPWAGTTEEVRVSFLPKGTDPYDRRTIMDFGPEHRAMQYLVQRVLKVIADLHPHQFGTGNGGVHRAIKHVAQAMKDGFIWAVEIDIENCFPSFDGKKIIDLLPLPKEVIERVILPAHLNLVPGNLIDLFGTMSGGVYSHPPHNTPVGPASDLPPATVQILAEARRGIPQGSASSSLLAEMLLAIPLKQLPKIGAVCGYVDNFLLMAKSEHDAVVLMETLASALKQHPAGPLRPKVRALFPAGHPVEFLGYHAIGGPGAIKLEPSAKNLAEFESEMKEGLRALKNPKLSTGQRSRKSEHLARKVHGWPARTDCAMT